MKKYKTIFLICAFVVFGCTSVNKKLFSQFIQYNENLYEDALITTGNQKAIFICGFSYGSVQPSIAIDDISLGIADRKLYKIIFPENYKKLNVYYSSIHSNENLIKDFELKEQINYFVFGAQTQARDSLLTSLVVSSLTRQPAAITSFKLYPKIVSQKDFLEICRIDADGATEEVAVEKILTEQSKSNIRYVAPKVSSYDVTRGNTIPTDSKFSADYVKAVTEAIRNNLKGDTCDRGWEIKSDASFIVEQLRNGKILNVIMKKSTGSQACDNVISDAIKSTDPLPIDKNGAYSREIEISFSPKALDKGSTDQKTSEFRKKSNTPRIYIYSSTTAPQSLHDYVERFFQKIERYGNFNYPNDLRGNAFGQVMVTIYVHKDGEISELTVDLISGPTILVDTARNMIKRASPFDSFSDSIKETPDILVIKRSIKFTATGLEVQTK